MRSTILDFNALISGNSGLQDTVGIDAMSTSLHVSPKTARTWRMLIVVLLPLVLLTTTGTRVLAGGEETIPRNGETVSKTPPLIQVRVPGTGEIEVTLENDKGAIIPFTGDIERSNGTVALKPPALVYGTYIVRWVSGADSGWFSFSVGEPTAVVTSGTFNPYIVAVTCAFLLLSLAIGLIGGVKKSKKMYLVSIFAIAVSLVGLVGAVGAKSEYQLKKLTPSTLGVQECLKSSNLT